MLNVSRSFPVGPLEAREIDDREVVVCRRISTESLLAHLRRDDQTRREAADELTEIAQQMGIG